MAAAASIDTAVPNLESSFLDMRDPMVDADGYRGDEDESIPSVSSSVIEPKPDTAEIPMVSDPFTGEVRG